ncbi:hypothetical protein DFH27DRAFT_652071 [Peziza echinospora]|nr:hypothetical protein DFH27DRAFT_652071 [Peziza echinospora]
MPQFTHPNSRSAAPSPAPVSAPLAAADSTNLLPTAPRTARARAPSPSGSLTNHITHHQQQPAPAPAVFTRPHLPPPPPPPPTPSIYIPFEIPLPTTLITPTLTLTYDTTKYPHWNPRRLASLTHTILTRLRQTLHTISTHSESDSDSDSEERAYLSQQLLAVEGLVSLVTVLGGVLRGMIDDVRTEMGDVGGGLDDVRARRVLLGDCAEVDVWMWRLVVLGGLLRVEAAGRRREEVEGELLRVMERARVEFSRKEGGRGRGRRKRGGSE